MNNISMSISSKVIIRKINKNYYYLWYGIIFNFMCKLLKESVNCMQKILNMRGMNITLLIFIIILNFYYIFCDCN